MMTNYRSVSDAEVTPQGFRQLGLGRIVGNPTSAQVSGRADLTYEETMTYDLDYVNNHSLARDLAILAKTLPVVIARKGAR